MHSTGSQIRTDAAHAHRPGLGATAVGLDERERLVALAEQRLETHWQERSRHLREEETRLDRQSATLTREKARFVQEHAERLHEAQEAAEEVRKQRRLLQLERVALEQERGYLERERRRAVFDSPTYSKDPLPFHSTSIQSGGDLELACRELEAGWRELRQQELSARQRRDDEERQLNEQWQALEQERNRLRQVELAWEQEKDRGHVLHQNRLEELEGLEVRIRNYHLKLRTLREEAARLEAELSAGEPTVSMPVEPAADATPHLVHPLFKGDLQQFLATIIEDLADQCRCLAEQQEAIARIKRAWQWEWDAALTQIAERDQELDRREAAIDPREQSLSLAEKLVQRRDAELNRLHQRFQCWEARLFQQESSLRFQRRRLFGYIKARNAAVREQQQMLAEQRAAWEREWTLRNGLARQARSRAEAARQDYVRLRETYRRQLAELETRHRLIAERELVLRRLQQQYLTEQPDMVAAEQELNRRHRHWAKLAAEPIRGVRKQRVELEKRGKHLEAYRRYLLETQEKLEREEAAAAYHRSELETERGEMAVERLRWLKEMQAWRDERARLLDHTRDLKDQIDRLVLILADNTPPDPPLALVA